MHTDILFTIWTVVELLLMCCCENCMSYMWSTLAAKVLHI